MKPAAFSYHRPRTLAQALATCAQTPGAKVLAGGQSLIPLLSMRLASVPALVDINGIPELGTLSVEPTGVRFGATLRHSQLLTSAQVAQVQPMVPAALAHVAHATIRNRGTTLGSIVHADPAGEMPAVFALLGGTLTAQSVRGTRELTAAELFLGPLETSLAPDEIATDAFLPALPPGHGVAFDEVARRHGDYALCAVGVVAGVDGEDRLTSVRAGYVSVCEVPTVVDLTSVLAGAAPSEASMTAAGDLALGQLDPEADIHASARYRAQLVRVLTARVVRAAHADAVRRRHEAT